MRLTDQSAVLLERGERNIRQAQQVLQEAGFISADEAVAAVKRLRCTDKLDEACAGVQLLIEAVTEDLGVKRDVFAQCDGLCPPGALLASNTSGLSITEIAGATRRPHLVAGMHFWNPPHIVPLVEVIKGKDTADDTTHCLMDTARRLGKRPIFVRKDIPGFVGNRMQYAVMREALHLLAEGIASAEDIDTAMTAGPGLRYGFLGPLQTADLGGMDVFLAVSRYLFPALNSKSAPPALMTELVRKGNLGAKSGEGFYSYAGDKLDEYLARRDRAFLGCLEVLNREGSQ